MPPSSRKRLRVVLAIVLVSAAGALWWAVPERLGQIEILSMDDLTVAGPGMRLERVGGGAQLVSFGRFGAVLGIPINREVKGCRLRLDLANVQGLAWAGISASRVGPPRPEPVSMGRAFTADSTSVGLDLSLPDGAYRAIHVALRPRGRSGRFTLQSIELRPRPVRRPPASVLLSVALLVGGAASFAWLAVSVWLRLRPPERRRLAAASVVFVVGSAALLLGALALERVDDGESGDRTSSALGRAAGFPAWVLSDLRSDLRHLGLQADVRADDRMRRIGIHLSPQALATLEARRDEALERGVLVREDGDEVNGYLALDGGEPVRIRTRLKGDWVDHLAGRAFSLRVRVRGQDAILGMRRFSIQRPQTRVGHYEAIVLEQMRSEGIIAPRYEFARFSVNGEEIGVMAVEEFMSRELLEANRRREGVILALDEDDLWRQRLRNDQLAASPGEEPRLHPVSILETAHHSPVRTFQERAVLRDPTLRQQYAEATGLLRGYFEGRLAPEDVFDVVLLGRFFAIVNLWNATHPTWWHNVRVYFNPVTRLLEPIAFDINVPLARPTPGRSQGWRGSDFFHLRGSERFLESYHEALGRLREAVLSGELEAGIREWEAAHYARLGPDDFQDAPYPVSLLRARLAALDRTRIERRDESRYDPGPPVSVGPRPALETFVHVFWVRDGEGAYLEFQNVTDRPVTIDSLDYRHRRLTSAVPLDLGPLRVPPGDRPDARLRVPVPYDPLDLDGRIVAVASFDEHNAGRVVEARRYFPAAEHAAFRPETRDVFLARFPFVAFVPDEAYRIRAGSWGVDSDLIVPDDAPLVLDAGVTLRFAPGTRLVLRSALVAKGEAERPIRLLGQAGGWAGVVVLQAGERSELQHVEIEGIAEPAVDRWRLTGAVTFYESDVTMNGVRIHDTQTEDALNILRSDFVLEDFEVAGVPSDALDVDFGEGRIVGSRFLDMGGDAVDVSGTRVTVEDTVVRGARDKALSVGEASTFTGRAVDAADVGTGIASKDASFAILMDSRFADVTHAAFMAYVKKREYGPARLVVRETDLERVGRKAVPAGASTIEIDGRRASRVELDVERLYGTGYMAK
jgi:hypothetical protein